MSADYVLTPNMNLQEPIIGTAIGPNYAISVNASLTLIDQHSHLPGAGVPIVPAAININSALTFADNPATNLQYAGFYTQGSSPGVTGSLYVKLGSEGTPRPDLWFNDGVTDVQLTSAGAVNATVASIPGESYAGGTFTWRQGSGSTTPANMDFGSIVLRPNVAATTNGVTLAPPSAISSAYTLQLPQIPGSDSFLKIDTLGAISAGPAVTGGLDHTNLSASAGILGTQLANLTVDSGQIAAQAIGTSKIADSAVTLIKMGFTPSFTFNAGNGLSGGGTISNWSGSTTYTLAAPSFGSVGSYVMAQIAYPNGGSAGFTVAGSALNLAYIGVSGTWTISGTLSGTWRGMFDTNMASPGDTNIGMFVRVS